MDTALQGKHEDIRGEASTPIVALSTGDGLIYRQARPTDSVAIFTLLRRMHKESTTQLEPINETKAITVILQAIQRGIVFVAHDNMRRIVGSVAVVFDSPWWSEEETPNDLWWYVLPEFRQTGAGLALLRLVNARLPSKGRLRMANIAAGADLDDRMAAAFKRIARLERVGSIYLRAE